MYGHQMLKRSNLCEFATYDHEVVGSLKKSRILRRICQHVLAQLTWKGSYKHQTHRGIKERYLMLVRWIQICRSQKQKKCSSCSKRLRQCPLHYSARLVIFRKGENHKIIITSSAFYMQPGVAKCLWRNPVGNLDNDSGP